MSIETVVTTPAVETVVCKCVECGELLGGLHHPGCGKREVDANYVVPDDCVIETELVI